MSLTLNQKFDIMLEALEAIGSYEKCNCGCLDARQARIANMPVHTWAIARDALEKIGEKPKVFTYDEASCTYRQSS
jgi:hypothetical protein